MTASAAAKNQPAPRSMVEVRRVSKTYAGGVEALNDISIDFAEGQLTSLLGPSGCGKTTLLKIIGGLIPFERGEVLINGKPVAGPGPDRGMVFQNFALLPWADRESRGSWTRRWSSGFLVALVAHLAGPFVQFVNRYLIK